MHRPWRRRVGVAWLAASLLLGACRAQDDDPGPLLPPPDAAQQQTEPEPVTEAPMLPPVEIPEPDTAFSGPSEPPAGLSEDVPLFPDATTIGSMTSPTRGTIVNLSSSEPIDAIFAWYQQELPRRGWLLAKQNATAFSRLLTATQDARKATVLIKTGPSGTTILITVAQAGGG